MFFCFNKTNEEPRIKKNRATKKSWYENTGWNVCQKITSAPFTEICFGKRLEKHLGQLSTCLHDRTECEELFITNLTVAGENRFVIQ